MLRFSLDCTSRPGCAARLETEGTRHRFVYAIALHDLGQPQQAIAELQKLLRSSPQNEQVLLALANYHAELGERDQARGYVETLIKIAPGVYTATETRDIGSPRFPNGVRAALFRRDDVRIRGNGVAGSVILRDTTPRAS